MTLFVTKRRAGAAVRIGDSRSWMSMISNWDIIQMMSRILSENTKALLLLLSASGPNPFALATPAPINEKDLLKMDNRINIGGTIQRFFAQIYDPKPFLKT